eukprot:2213080-Alexandrium_andersonii.AAC.1
MTSLAELVTADPLDVGAHHVRKWARDGVVRERGRCQPDEPLHHPEICALPPLPTAPSRFAGPGPRAGRARQHGGVHR